MNDIILIVIIPIVVSLVVIFFIYQQITQIRHEAKRLGKSDDLARQANVMVTFIVYVALLISEVFYALIVYLQLQKKGLTTLDRSIVGVFVGASVLALLLKGAVGRYFFRYLPYKEEAIATMETPLARLAQQSMKSKMTTISGNSLVSKKQQSFIIVGLVLIMSVVEGVGILGLIYMLQYMSV